MDLQYSYMVCTRCMTFNHQKYIEDAMNGFCMQETNFPYVCVIVDDSSTDGEAEVIKKYFDAHFDLSENGETDDYVMTFGQHKVNKNCYFAVLYLKYNHYSIKKSKIPYYSRWQDDCKYIAVCEGDDYWIAKDKLQRQVDFLEENEEYGMCYTKVKNFVQKNKTFQKKTGGERIEGFEHAVKYNPRIHMLTVCFRKTIYDRYIEEIKPSTRNWRLGDSPLIFYFAHESKIKFFDEYISGVYRIMENSASHTTDWNKLKKFRQSVCEVQMFFASKYNIKNIEPIYILYFFETNNRIECKKLNSKNLPFKSKLISFCSKSIILWNLLNYVVWCKSKLIKI